MGANTSSHDQSFPVSDLHSRKPWPPRFEPQVSPFKANNSSSFIVEIKTKTQWESRLKALKNTNKLLVIEFTAKWCGPCKSLEPRVAELASKYTDIEFVKIDVDVLKSVWMETNLHSLPAIVFMKRGQEVERIVGVKVDELEWKLQKYKESSF